LAELAHEQVRFNILGSLECRAGEKRFLLGGPVQERVLVALLLEAGQVLPVLRLVDAVWDEDPPATASHQVRKAVATLRQLIPGGSEMIVTDGHGYRAVLDREQLDLNMFSALLQRARDAVATGHNAEAADDLRAALQLWRGPVLSGSGGPVIEAASEALQERRLTAIEQLIDLRLALGETGELVADLRELVRAHPLRETLRGQLVLSLFRSGRQAEALEEYARVRKLLAEDLGIDPGDPLTKLYAGILRNDPELAAPEQPGAPPASAPPPVGPRCTLPYGLRDFTGRERELRNLMEYADESGTPGPRIVAIDGMGGCGKTSLAVQAAHRLIDRYSDAQLYIDLRGFTSGERPLPTGSVAEALLRMLGVRTEHIPGTSEGRIALWRATATQHRLLLLLDNAVDAAQVRPLLPVQTGSPNTLVLLTSRTRLVDLDGAHWLSLGMMSSQDSVALIAETLGKERVAAEPGAAAALADLCGYLPLALRIAAARLRNRPRWSIRHLIDRLGNEARRLDELRSGERSVMATLRLSYDGLAAEHRAAFRLLGKHPGREVDAYSVAALLGSTPHRAEDVLEHLLDTHLVQQHETGRYAFHDLVRSFAQWLGNQPGEGPADGDSAAIERLLDYYLRATDQACELMFTGQVAADPGGVRATAELPPLANVQRAREWLDREQVSLVGAVALAGHQGLDRHAAGLARNVVFQLDTRARFEEFRELVDIAVAASRKLGDPPVLRQSLSDLAVADWKLGRFEEGVTAAAAGLDLAVRLSDQRGEARDAGVLGLLLATLGRFDEALPRLQQSIDLKRTLGAPRAEAESLINLSSLYEHWGRYEQAAEAASRAVELNQRLGALDNVTAALTALALARLGLGETEEARVSLDQARAMTDESNSPGDSALALAVCAETYRRLGLFTESSGFADRALELSRSDRTPNREATVDNIVGALRRHQGNHASALELHENAYRIASAIGSRIEQARALDGVAAAHEALGDTVAAEKSRTEADELFVAMGVPVDRRRQG
jgi:DNA-binding SARP family transcriptional activator